MVTGGWFMTLFYPHESMPSSFFPNLHFELVELHVGQQPWQIFQGNGVVPVLFFTKKCITGASLGEYIILMSSLL